MYHPALEYTILGAPLGSACVPRSCCGALHWERPVRSSWAHCREEARAPVRGRRHVRTRPGARSARRRGPRTTCTTRSAPCLRVRALLGRLHAPRRCAGRGPVRHQIRRSRLDSALATVVETIVDVPAHSASIHGLSAPPKQTLWWISSVSSTFGCNTHQRSRVPTLSRLLPVCSFAYATPYPPCIFSHRS